MTTGAVHQVDLLPKGDQLSIGSICLRAVRVTAASDSEHDQAKRRDCDERDDETAQAMAVWCAAILSSHNSVDSLIDLPYLCL